jgi:hypothetical protein
MSLVNHFYLHLLHIRDNQEATQLDNTDKTEVLRPWIIQYLDEIPKPTVWKDFLENMDVENGAILDECDEHVFVDAIGSPDVDEENYQTEVTCLWNEKIESLSKPVVLPFADNCE